MVPEHTQYRSISAFCLVFFLPLVIWVMTIVSDFVSNNWYLLFQLSIRCYHRRNSRGVTRVVHLNLTKFYRVSINIYLERLDYYHLFISMYSSQFRTQKGRSNSFINLNKECSEDVRVTFQTIKRITKKKKSELFERMPSYLFKPYESLPLQRNKCVISNIV